MLGLSGIVVVGWQFRAMRVSDGQKSVAAAAKIITVTVLGRLEPHGEMIYLTAPTSTQENRIDQKKAIASR
jgi:HlyD family secretion protein